MRNESDANVLMYILRGLRGVKRGCKDVDEGSETDSSSQLAGPAGAAKRGVYREITYTRPS